MNAQEKFVRHTIVDQQQQGFEAGIFAHPADWRSESNVYWNYQNTALPSVVYARTGNPQGSEMLEFLPMECFSWTEPDPGMAFTGQNVNGLINMPPMPGTEALIQLLIPKYRGNRSGLRVVAASGEPTAAKNHPQIPPENVSAFKIAVRIEYSENGRLIEEEFHVVHTLVRFPPVYNGWGMTSFTSWSLTDLCCFRAEKETFERGRPTFIKIRDSFQINPQWVEFSNKISQQLIHNAGQIGDQLINQGWDRLAANAENMRETQQRNESYINQQRERINNSYNTPPPTQSLDSGKGGSEYGSHERFVDLIYGRESIYNSENSANEKVEGYHDHIWKDEFGRTQATDDPNYDPNIGSNINWTRAVKKRVGD